MMFLQIVTSPNKEKYPVITLVLYFGTAPWQKAKRLSEAIPVEARLKPYVNDYQMNLFEVAFLSDEQISCFHSDFRAEKAYGRESREQSQCFAGPAAPTAKLQKN